MILFGMVALNEIDYIDAVLESVKPFCDKMIVIESCARRPFEYLYNEGFVTKGGLSTDGTTEYLQERADIVYLPIGILEGTVEGCALPLFHDYANNGDHIWIGTGNEVYFKDKAEKLYRMMRKDNVPYIDIGLVIMWKDLRHRLFGGGWGESTLRLYKYKQEPVDFDYKTCTDFPLQVKFDQEYLNGKHKVLDACMKLAYARDEKRVFYKIALQDIEYNDRLNNLKRYTSIDDYIHRTHHFYNNIHDKGVRTEWYRGEYPVGVCHLNLSDTTQSGWEDV